MTEAQPKSRRTKLLRFLVQFVLGAAGIAFIVIELRRATRNGWHAVIPSAPRFAVAEVLLVVGLLTSAATWRYLIGPHDRPWLITRGFFIAVLAKYVPGGIWQAVGQAGSATQTGVPARRAVTAVPVNALILAVSGAVVGAGVAFTATSIAVVWRVLAGGALLSVVLLDRRWIGAVLNLARRLVKRIPQPDALPEQSWILRGFVVSVASVVALSAAFAVLVHGGLAELFAFAAAWTIGLILIPVPNGLGVREALLLALVTKPNAIVIGASIAIRVAMMLAEVATAAISSAWAAARDRRALTMRA